MHLLRKITLVSLFSVGVVLAEAPSQAPVAPASVALSSSSVSAEGAAVAPASSSSVTQTLNVSPEPVPEPVAVRPVNSTPPAAVVAPGTTFVVIPAPRPVETKAVDSVRYGEKQKMHVGIHAGVGSVEFIADDGDDDMDGLNWNAGLVVSFPLSDYSTGFQVEAVVHSRLVTRVYDDSSVSSKDRIQQYMLSFPLLFTFRPMASRFEFLFGPQMSVSLYDHLKVYTDGKTDSSSDLLDDSSREPIDWALVMGFGIMANPHVIFDVRFDVGISDMYSDLYMDGDYQTFTPVSVQMGMTLVY